VIGAGVAGLAAIGEHTGGRHRCRRLRDGDECGVHQG
jgi:hypothetical protein